MILDITSITRPFKKKRPKFTDDEYTAIRIVSSEYLKTFKKQENPDEGLIRCMEVLESVHDKVKHK